MRYSLGTLVILTVFLPPLLAIIWFLSPTDLMNELAGHCWWPGILLTTALTALSCFYVPCRTAEPASLRPLGTVVLWSFESLALWNWISGIIAIGGWIFIWGDNEPQIPDPMLHFLAASTAICIATVTTIRMRFSLATVNYIRAVICMTGLLLILLAPYFLWYIAFHGKLPPLSFH
jgi:hypothetical protein